MTRTVENESWRDQISSLLQRPVLEAAPGLLGYRIGTRIEGRRTEVVVTEVEAYAGYDDPASHAFRGRTPRNHAMFDDPGTLYVYRSYGIHWCINIVVREEGVPHAVLLRGGAPVEGRGVVVDRRRREDHLTDGPGKLCEALGVTGDHDRTLVIDGPVRLRGPKLSGAVSQTPRIGISIATERPWRYVLTLPSGAR